MIGQKRRQPTTAGDSGGRSRAVSVGGDSTSSSSDDERGMLFFRHIPRSSWFCRKFWKSKSSKRSPDSNGSSEGLASTDSSASSSASAASSASSASDFVQRQRHRYRRFCKSVTKRSRTTEAYDRRPEDAGDSLGDEYALATEEDLKRLEAVIVSKSCSA